MKLNHAFEHFADVYIYPGEDELRSLALSALRALKGEVVKEFKSGSDYNL